MISPELETLDQLLGGPLSVDVIRKLYPDEKRFISAILAMLKSGEIDLLDASNQRVPEWDYQRSLSTRNGAFQLEITDRGVKRIG